MNFIIDTNAYSDYVRGHAHVVSWLGNAEIVYVPAVVVGELKRGFYYGSTIKQNLNNLDKFLAKPRTKMLDIDAETAEHYGRLSAYLKQHGTPISVNDIWIAALAVQYNLPILTSDQEFKFMPQVTILPARERPDDN